MKDQIWSDFCSNSQLSEKIHWADIRDSTWRVKLLNQVNILHHSNTERFVKRHENIYLRASELRGNLIWPWPWTALKDFCLTSFVSISYFCTDCTDLVSNLIIWAIGCSSKKYFCKRMYGVSNFHWCYHEILVKTVIN